MQDDLIKQKQEELEILQKYGELVKRKQQEIDELRPDAEAWKAFSGSKNFVDARSAANTLTRRTGYNVGSNVTLYRYLREIGVMPLDGSYAKAEYQGIRFQNCNCIVNGKAVKVVHISGSGIDWLADKIIDDSRFLKKFSQRQLKNRGLLE